MDELQRANLRVVVPTRIPGANLETMLFLLESSELLDGGRGR